MRFYDRKKELEMLGKAHDRHGADLVIISGRRRIGKSRLIDEFAKDKKAISVLIVPKEEKQVAADIEGEIRAKTGYSPSFSTFKDALEYLFEQNTGLICLDEFPNVLLVSHAIPYELQKLWDKYRETKETLLIISGSYAGMMSKLFTAKKSPLFNRATGTISLQQLPFETVVELLKDLGVSRPAEQISYFCVFGGVPYYYMLLEKQGGREFEKAINALFFDVGAQLKEEGENVLKQEFGNAYAKYYAILEAINGGRVSMNEISQKVGVRSTTLTKYMKKLQHDFKIIERTVPFGQNPAKSKKGLYSIADNTLAFWFAHVYGKRASPLKGEINSFIGRRFETLCREFLASLLEKNGEKILKVGKWRGQVETEKGKFEQREIDLAIETDRAFYLGECKWTDEKVGEPELRHLKESAKCLLGTKKPVKWILFSKSGFNTEEVGDILLFDPQKIVGLR